MLLPVEGCGRASLAALAAVIGAPHRRLRLQKTINSTAECFMLFRSLLVNIYEAAELRNTHCRKIGQVVSACGKMLRFLVIGAISAACKGRSPTFGVLILELAWWKKSIHETTRTATKIVSNISWHFADRFLTSASPSRWCARALWFSIAK